MKLYPRRGFEWAENAVGVWCPLLSGNTGFHVGDANLRTNNHGMGTGYQNASQAWQGSEFGTVTGFNGTSNFIAVANDPSLQITKEMTIGTWVRTGTDITTVRMLVAKSVITPLALSYRVWVQNSRVNFQISVDGGVSNVGTRTSTMLQTNTWYHVVCRFLPSRFQDVLINGVNANSGFTGMIRPNIFSDTNPLAIGAQFNTATTRSGFFDGLIGEAVLVTQFLSDDQIANWYNVKPAGLWTREPTRQRSLFGQLLASPNRRRSSRFLAFPG